MDNLFRVTTVSAWLLCSMLAQSYHAFGLTASLCDSFGSYCQIGMILYPLACLLGAFVSSKLCILSPVSFSNQNDN